MTKKQERARARRRWERRQVKLADRATRRTRLRTITAAVATLVAVLALAVWVGLSRAGEGSRTASGASPSSTASFPPGCSAPPPPPGTSAQLALPDPALVAGGQWEATVTTNCGDIVIDLDAAAAPQAVASFVQLARADYWLNAPCHRLVAEPAMTVLQCGDPTGTGGGTPGYGFGVENAPNDGVYDRGVVAMARTSDTHKGNGGQFFFVAEKTTIPDPVGYTVFGRVRQGLDIVDSIVAGGVAPGGTSATDGTPKVPISILRVAVTEKKA